MPVDIDIEDNTREIKRAIKDGLKKGVQDATDRIEEIAVNNAPIGDGTGAGNLQRSIYSDPVSETSTSLRADFGADAEYAAAQEWGSASRGQPFAAVPPMVANDWPVVPPGKQTWDEYVITPNEADYLRFTVHDAETGEKKTIFTKKVVHPGVEPQPYMRPAIDQVRFKEAEKIFKGSVEHKLRAFLIQEYTG